MTTWWALEIARWVSTLGVTGWTLNETGTTGNVFIDHHPDSPDLSVAVMGQPGPTPIDPHFGYDRPGVQFIVRGAATAAGRLAAYSLADRIRAAVNERGAEALPAGARLIRFSVSESAPGGIGVDEAGRPEYVLNAVAEVTAATTQRPLG